MLSERAYQYSAVDMNFVYANPEEFIIPENLEACKLLWSKNIFTVMCNNYDNDNSWITISKLDESNQKLFEELCKSNPENFGYTWGGVGIRVPVKPEPGADIFSAFQPLIEMFSYQDVQKDGYMTKEDFLNYECGCYKLIPNPDFIPNIKHPSYDDYKTIEELREALRFFDAHYMVPEKLRVFDASKMEKSFEEYFADSRFTEFYDADNERIYYNEMYYNAHLQYKRKCQTPNI